MKIYQNSILKSRKKIRFHSFSIKYSKQELISLIKRLIIQAIRRPATVVSGIIQPLLWLILFGGLFQNLPLNLFNIDNNYGPFLSCGIMIFTSFTGALNSGLPLIFDREFGFLNRLLVSPLISKNAIIFSAGFFIILITMIQNIFIIAFSLKFFNFNLNIYQLILIILISLLITSSISSVSLGLAFVFPGHIEFLAFILVINLPMLFSSTALAPFYFMPYWLQIIAKLNPLTYAIESIRFIIFSQNNYLNSNILCAYGINLNVFNVIIFLLTITLISFNIIKDMISNRLE